jgi:hypothetical protein
MGDLFSGRFEYNLLVKDYFVNIQKGIARISFEDNTLKT